MQIPGGGWPRRSSTPGEPGERRSLQQLAHTVQCRGAIPACGSCAYLLSCTSVDSCSLQTLELSRLPKRWYFNPGAKALNGVLLVPALNHCPGTGKLIAPVFGVLFAFIVVVRIILEFLWRIW